MRNEKLTKNFKLKEFVESRFFGEYQEEVNKSFLSDNSARSNINTLAEQLQALRDALNKPVSVNIAYRPVWWEEKQGRSGKSQHCLGKAADIVVKGIPAPDVAKIIKKLIQQGKMLEGGVGTYSNFTHYDIRGFAARWRG